MKISTAWRFVVLCVLFFAVVLFSATTTSGSGEYSAAVSAGINYCVEAHNTKCYYAVKQKRWLMKAARTMEEARGDGDKGKDGNLQKADDDTKEITDGGPVAAPALSPSSSVSGQPLTASSASAPGPQGPTGSEGHSVPDKSGGKGPGGSGSGSDSDGVPSTEHENQKGKPLKPELPKGAAPSAEKKVQSGKTISTNGVPEGTPETTNTAAGNKRKNGEESVKRTTEKKDDAQGPKSDGQSDTIKQSPRTASSSTEKNTAISSTVSETTSDAANIGITAPVRGRFVCLLLFLLLTMLWHVAW